MIKTIKQVLMENNQAVTVSSNKLEFAAMTPNKIVTSLKPFTPCKNKSALSSSINSNIDTIGTDRKYTGNSTYFFYLRLIMTSHFTIVLC